MRRRDLIGLITASAVVTLDGTSATVALPAVRDALQLRYSDMQWIGDAPLLALAALLLPAGVVADRLGRTRTVHLGLVGFMLASLACAAATSGGALIGLRLAQGAAGALILPGVVATMRGAYQDGATRTRVFGLWAAGTGLASAAGPLLGGGIIDLFSWRAVFLLSALVSGAGLALLWRTEADEVTAERRPVPVLSTLALAVAVAAAAYVLIEVPAAGWDNTAIAAAARRLGDSPRLWCEEQAASHTSRDHGLA
jgi:MFS transporter, DHA2 family, methylenomycin A resistance protein